MEKIDLLKSVKFEGCSAKLPARDLQEALKSFTFATNDNLIVGISTHDDGGVYKINDEQALILTTDFFPPVCSDPYEFGQIAAANALSDVFAMGGKVLTALNIVLFPVSMPLSVLQEILEGGQDKLLECGGVIAGGHTITDDTIKYGMAVTGMVHPEKIITNASAKCNDLCILTKPIGTGIVIAGKRVGKVSEVAYQQALESMKKLNDKAADVMQKYGIKCATDITGFGLAGHIMKLAKGSDVSIEVTVKNIPVFSEVEQLLDIGCIPGAAFRNLEFIENDIFVSSSLSYEQKMLTVDAQTSGGILMCVPETSANEVVDELRKNHPQAAIIGRVIEKQAKAVYLI